MRIGFFADMYLPYISGVTNHLRLYKRYFEDQGHEVFLFTFGYTDYPDDEPNIVRSPAVALGKTGWNIRLSLDKQVRSLIPTLDIAHIHHPFLSGHLAAGHLKKHGIPIVFTNHSRYDQVIDHYVRYAPRSARHAVATGFLKGFLTHCSLVIAPSNYTAQWLRPIVHDPTLVRVIPDGIKNSDLNTPLTRMDLGLSDTDIVLCTVGRIAPEKNFLYLLDEFLTAARNDERLRLLVIGDGPDRKKAQEKATASGRGEAVIFAGQIPYEDLSAYEAASDLFITASLIESFGMAAVEALTEGLPVVAVKAAGIAENVTHTQNGLLIEAPEPGALATQILDIAANPALRNALSEGARRSATRFTLENTAKVVLESYEELLAPR